MKIELSKVIAEAKRIQKAALKATPDDLNSWDYQYCANQAVENLDAELDDEEWHELQSALE